MNPNTKTFLEIIQTDDELFDKYFAMVQELKEKVVMELVADVSKYPTVEATDVEYGELTKQIVTKLKWARARKGYTGRSIF